MVAWAYGQHRRLLIQHSEEVVRSQSGVRQGDPLGPLLFALTMQEPLEQVGEMGLARPVEGVIHRSINTLPRASTTAGAAASQRESGAQRLRFRPVLRGDL
jgi:hypothetical protein